MMGYGRVACGLGSMFWVVWGLFGHYFGRNGHGGDGSEVDTCDDVDSAGFQASWAKVRSVRLNLSPNKFNCTWVIPLSMYSLLR